MAGWRLGIGLGIAVVIATGIPLYLADRLTGGTESRAPPRRIRRQCGRRARVCIAANPVYAEAAKSATLLVAACVVVTAILSPILTAAVASACRYGANRGGELAR